MSMVQPDAAFFDVPGQKSISLRPVPNHTFQFTRNWFKYRNQSTWSTFFPKMFDPAKPITMLQIGVFEGMDLIWCLQNILTHPDSRVLAVDPWMPTTKLDAQYMEDVEKRARHNLSPWADRVAIIKGESQKVLSDPDYISQWQDFSPFDLCVIDGDHTKQAVIEDAENCRLFVKSGSYLVFDDVRNKVFKKDHVQQGLDVFIPKYRTEFALQWKHRYCDCYRRI